MQSSPSILISPIDGAKPNLIIGDVPNAEIPTEIIQYCSDSKNRQLILYQGQIQNNKKNGFGQAIYSHFSYAGEWKDDKREGQGTLYYVDGSIYEGTWKNNERNGHGIMKYNNDSIYKGKWKNDRQNGQGISRSANGDVYNGQWLDGYKHGQGTLNYADGSIYDGEWKENKRHGYGVLNSADGSIYEGEWRNNEQMDEMSGLEIRDNKRQRLE